MHKRGIIVAIALLAFLIVGNVRADETQSAPDLAQLKSQVGIIQPDGRLYGLKIFLEDLVYDLTPGWRNKVRYLNQLRELHNPQ